MQALAERGDDTGYNFNPAVRMCQENGGYLVFSLYSHWIPLWCEKFGEENVLVLRTGHLQADPVGILGKCFTSLDIAPIDITEQAGRNETSKTNRLPPLFLVRIERKMPKAIRGSRPYNMLRWRSLRAWTPTSPDTMSPQEKDFVHDCLREDIVFHESLAT